MRETEGFEEFALDDGRGLYPERLKAPVPLGTRTRIKRRAEAEGISAGELVRRAVAAYISGDKSHREPQAA